MTNLKEAIALFASDINEAVKRVPSLSLYKGFLIRVVKGNRFLVIKADKINESKKFMLQENITGLEINMSLGYPDLTVEFLKDFTFIDMLAVIHQPIREVSEINGLHRLKYLSLDSYFYSQIDFNNFPDLTFCSIHWTENAKNLFLCPSLKELHTRSYRSSGIAEYTQLKNLEHLSIVNSPIGSLIGLGKLQKLKELKLSLLKNIVSITGIEKLTLLEELKIQSCPKISSIEQVRNLKNLKILWLIECKEIQSIKPIEALDKLENFLFYGSTNIVDGDLSPLTRVNSIKKIAFKNRRHYSHKIDHSTHQVTPRG